MHASNKINKVKLFSLSEQKAFSRKWLCPYIQIVRVASGAQLHLRVAFLIYGELQQPKATAGRPAGVPTTLVCTFPAFNDLNSREHRGKHTTTTTTGVGRLQEREQRRRQNRDFCRSVCVCVCAT
jgi:hypothetical protein